MRIKRGQQSVGIRGRSNPINVNPDGTNVNENGGSTDPSNLISLVKNKADIGIALDGDADRCVLVDEKVVLLMVTLF